MKAITVKLDPHSIENAINDIRAYEKEVKQKSMMLVQRLLDYGTNIARIKIVELGAVDTGDLLSGVSGYFSPLLNAGFVRVTSDHAAFVEFGTGVSLDNTLHPNAEYLARAAWAYGSGSKIFTTKDGKIGWIYPTDDGGFKFTEGQSSRPFMYETALELQRVFPNLVKAVFSS